MIGFITTALNIPVYYYLISLAAVAAVWLILLRRATPGRRLAVSLLAGYTVFILIQGIIKRDMTDEVHYKLVPFWSYIAVISEGNTGLVPQMVGNVLSFMPVGFLVNAFVGPSRGRLLCAVLAGFGLSCVIEVSQLVFKRGLFEFDDIFHNTLGALLGALIWTAVYVIYKKVTTQKTASAQNDSDNNSCK